MIKSLTGLRFYAAMLVFITHFFLFKDMFHVGFTSPMFFFLEGLGALGVSLFFILSGFILFVNYLAPTAKSWTLKSFLIARVARIYPVFLMALLIAAPIEMIGHRGTPFLPLLMPSLFMVHCLLPQSCGSINPPGWSISVEFVFYLCFPLLGLLFYQSIRRNLLIAFGLYLLYLVGINFFWPESFFSLPIFALNRLGEFLLGMTTGYVYTHYHHHGLFQKYGTHQLAKPLSIGLLAILFCWMMSVPFIVHFGLSHFPFMVRLFYLLYMVPGALFILLLALLDKYNASPGFLTASIVILGGEISYSLYLVHQLIIRYIRHALYYGFHIDLAQFSPWSLTLVGVLMLAFSLLAAYGMYRWVETPCRRKIIAAFSPIKPSKTK